MTKLLQIVICGLALCAPALSPTPVVAQRFEEELKLLDYPSLKFSEQDMRDIVANVGWIAKNVLWRTDTTIERARTALRYYKNETTTKAWELWRDDLNLLAQEVNMLINLAPAMDDPATATADKKKIDHFTKLLFAARSELENTRRDIERVLHKTQ